MGTGRRLDRRDRRPGLGTALATVVSAAAITTGAMAEPLPDPAKDPGIENTIGASSSSDTVGEDSAPAIERAIEDGRLPVSRARRGKVEEIITSARKRDEFLEDTPVAVTVLSPEELQDSGTIFLPQIQNLVPNLTIIPRRDGASFAIRGIGAFPNPWFDQGVGLYIDNVFIPRQQGNITELIDIQQIEVLRGPQGTLFGKNSEGGAVRITTTKPQMEPDAYATFRASSLTEVQTRAMLNLPIGSGWLEDKLAVRLNFGSSHRDDFVYNAYRDEGLGGFDTFGFLGALRFQPREDLVIDVSGLWNTSGGRQAGGNCAYVQPSSLAQVMNFSPDPTYGGVGPRYQYNAETYREACLESFQDRYRVQFDTPQTDRTNTQIIWGTGQWDVGEVGFLEDLQARFITSYRWYDTSARIDLDGTQFRIWESDTTGTNPDGGSPENGWSITEEIQVNAAAFDGRLNFVAGAFGYAEHIEQDQLLLTFPGTLAELGGGRGRLQFDADNWDWSLYTQADFALTDWLQLTAGVRYAQEKKSVDRLVTWPESTTVYPGPQQCQPGTGPGNTDANGRAIECVAVPDHPNVPNSSRVPASGRCRPGTGPILGPDGQFVATETICEPEPWSRSQKFENVSPMAAIRFTVPEDWLGDTPFNHVMAYFQYARGYKGGGFNGGALDNDPRQLDGFRPEFVDSFEVGVKTIAFDDRLTFNLTFFHADYQDLQLPSLRTIPAPEGCRPDQMLIDNGITECLPTTIVLTENAADADIDGIEAEFLSWPLPFLSLQGNMGLQDATLNDFTNAENPLTGLPVDRSGDRFSFTPLWNAHVALFTPFPIEVPDAEWLSGILTPRVDWTYRSPIQWFSPLLNDGATPDVALGPEFNLLNLRFTYIFDDTRAQVAVFAENLLDERPFGVNALGQRLMGTVLRYFPQGRAFGGSISYRF